MKIVQIGLCLTLLFLTQSIFMAEADVCEPHLSIENQRAKPISKEAQAILAKVIKDKISLSWPVEVCKCWISSLFGPRSTGFHNGVDFAAVKGTPVFAAADGVVEVAQKSHDKNGYGNMLLINHEGLQFKDEFGHTMQYKTRYAHLHAVLVAQGDAVVQGQKIGTVGATGHVIAKHAKADPSHLHFEVYRGAKRINPLLALFSSEDKAWVKASLQG